MVRRERERVAAGRRERSAITVLAGCSMVVGFYQPPETGEHRGPIFKA